MKNRKLIILIIFVCICTISGCSQNSVNTNTTDNADDDTDYAKTLVQKTHIIQSKLTKITFNSKALDKNQEVNIYLPAEYSTQNKYPVLYLLHGYSANEDEWISGIKIAEKADALIDSEKIVPLIIVAPEIDNSYGVNSEIYTGFPPSPFSSGLYEDYIIKDLVSYVDKNYSTISSREGRYIGGMSMGGWAALHLAFTHTDMFSKVGGHSPAIFLDGYTGGAMTWVYPNQKLRNERDPIEIAQNKNLTSLKVYLDCGDQDGLKFYEGCNKLFKILKSKGVDSQYHLGKGDHSDKYWEANAYKYLVFYAKK